MVSLRNWISRHPQIASWIVLSIGMVALLLWAARDVTGLLPTQLLALVIATIGLALAIIAEASLSFLGVGMPPTQPSLGTLIRLGNDVLQSGDWWLVVFPGVTLAKLVLAVNLLGDWLRDALNPKLR